MQAFLFLGRVIFNSSWRSEQQGRWQQELLTALHHRLLVLLPLLSVP